MTLQIDLPGELESKLNHLIEAGFFQSREEAILRATEKLIEGFDAAEESSAGEEDEGLFRRNQIYFEQHKQALQAQYRDQFVAVWRECVVDCDVDLSRLAERVYRQVGCVPVYIDRPSHSPARFHLSSPTLG